jgi:Ca2+-transporting ATPase
MPVDAQLEPNITCSSLPVDQVFNALGSSSSGLTSLEAARRLKEFGLNELPVPVVRPIYLRFIDQLTHFMALLLWLAGILAFIGNTPVLGMAIWAVVLVNGVFSFWQEYRAESALAALKKVLPARVSVIRDDVTTIIQASELVRGDLIILEAGDRVPADARLIAAEEFLLDVSVLTGESAPVARSAELKPTRRYSLVANHETAHEHPPYTIEKNPAPSEITNLVLAGTTVVGGRGRAVVYATGARTEFGHIARLTTTVTRDLNNLEIEVARIVRIITGIAIGMGMAVFVLGTFALHMEIGLSLIFAIGIIVANVPEGLLPTVSLALALGVQRMARRKALVRRLSAVEALSATTIICSDKTGTLTRNEMSVRSLWIPSKVIEIDEDCRIDPANHSAESPKQLLLSLAALCCNGELDSTTKSAPKGIGDPTELALLGAALDSGIEIGELRTGYKRLKEYPFDSQRRMMTVMIGNLDFRVKGLANSLATTLSSFHFPMIHGSLLITKGAPMEVLRRSRYIIGFSSFQELNDELRKEVALAQDNLAHQGYRVLGVAIRPVAQDSIGASLAVAERDLIFAGLVAMYDAPRPEVSEAIAQCHTAGIALTMVTGDYAITAQAVAQQIGLTREPIPAISGEQFAQLSDAQLRQMLYEHPGRIFARMSPEQKLRLVNAYKDIGHVVAVTGDGVNDAPALKSAHVGIAMGMNGTDVARQAADIILLDDNFATIVAAIEQGRGIYQNIRKFITYILASNIPEIVPFLVMVLFNIPPALTVIQILIIDLGTDMLPALALGSEPPEEQIMTRPPLSRKDRLLDFPLLARSYGFLGMFEALFSMLSFLAVWCLYGYSVSDLQNITPAILAGTASPEIMSVYTQSTGACLAGIILCQVGNLFACRSDSVPVLGQTRSIPNFIWAGICTELLLLALIMTSPFLKNTLELSTPTLPIWIFMATFPFFMVAMDTAYKKFSH